MTAANREARVERPEREIIAIHSGHGVNATHLAARLLADAIATQASSGFDVFAKVPHMAFPGGQRFRAPLLATGMLWERTKELF